MPSFICHVQQDVGEKLSVYDLICLQLGCHLDTRSIISIWKTYNVYIRILQASVLQWCNIAQQCVNHAQLFSVSADLSRNTPYILQTCLLSVYSCNMNCINCINTGVHMSLQQLLQKLEHQKLALQHDACPVGWQS